ncbi:hypothetical protein [Kordia sp.]|uniref:hypothetical protein n=1 Tax=Kordia sp. TaxID=1965332 RepID=UPI003D6A1054
MEELRFLSKYLALIVLVYGCFTYSSYANTKAKYFIFSIFYVVLTEFFGGYYFELFGMRNYPVYNTYTIVQLTFFLWWFRLMLDSKSRQKLVNLFIVLYWIFSFWNIMYGQGFLTGFQFYTYGVGTVFLLITICFYFIEIFGKDSILNITDSTVFWFALGILLFYATYMPFFFASKLFLNVDKWIYSLVLFSLNLIMYSCYIIGFYKSYRKMQESKKI